MKTHVFFCSVLKRQSLNICYSENNFEKKGGKNKLLANSETHFMSDMFPCYCFRVHGTDVATAYLLLLYRWDGIPYKLSELQPVFLRYGVRHRSVCCTVLYIRMFVTV
jgi:hypothetical protein